MTDKDVLWRIQDHTAAKHRLLRSFIDAWLPIIGIQEVRMNRTNPTVRIIDGFAGPGRYSGGEPGSPLILLEALIQHKALERLSKAKFEYLFLLQFPRCEVLYFLPITQMSRFVGTDGPSDAITALYGSDEWKEAVQYEGQARRDFLGELFERKLSEKSGIDYARSLRLHTKDGNDYRLTFGLQHLTGLKIAKDALWQVDPIAGTSYSATGSLGHETLFGLNESFNPEDLLAALREFFGQDWFTIEEAEEVTLVNTPFRLGHLKQATLEPAIKKGRFDYERASERGLAPGSRLRFKE